ncbi:MAG: hypothetical protein PWQ57_1517 [Desulfovibrionales bacterium]|nr:hypothetical protein [Desulfovibrionales bacterium]
MPRLIHSPCSAVLLFAAAFWMFFTLPVPPAAGQDLMNPTDFDHEVRKGKKDRSPQYTVRVALITVEDTELVNSPYGKHTGGEEIKRVGDASETTVSSPERYDTRRDAAGYSKRVRELITYRLSALPCVDLVDREDINALVREQEFAQRSTLVDKTSLGDAAVLMPQYLVKGYFTFNEVACKNERTPEEEAWLGNEDNTPPKKKLRLQLKVIDARTSQIAYVACGAGNGVESAVKASVKDLQQHMDLLLPTVRAIAVSGSGPKQEVRLNAGTDAGLVPGLTFYLVRHQGDKRFIDYDDIDYVAACEIATATPEKAQAKIVELLGESKPQKGDLVFFHYPEQY